MKFRWNRLYVHVSKCMQKKMRPFASGLQTYTCEAFVRYGGCLRTPLLPVHQFALKIIEVLEGLWTEQAYPCSLGARVSDTQLVALWGK